MLHRAAAGVRMRSLHWTGALLFGLVSSNGAAQPTPRTLEVPANASWQHAETGLILPSRVASLARISVRDTGSDELDLIADYESGDQALTTTVYVFRSQVPSAPLWFDRARTVLEQLKRFPIAPSGAAPVRTFAVPGGAAESGLRITYPLAGGSYSATALAIAPLNGWIVKVRMTSRSLDAEALDGNLASFIAGIRWPKNMATTPAAVPVEPCPTKLTLKRAKMIKPDMGQAIMGSLFAVAASSKAPSAPPVFCREPEQSVAYGVYRPAASTTSYLMALADAGRAISVGESFNIDRAAQPRYSVTLLDLDRSSVFPSFDRLPPMKQVIELLQSTRPLASNKVGSTTVSIDTTTVR